MVPFDDDDDDRESGGKGGGDRQRDKGGRFEGKGGKGEPEDHDDDVDLEDSEDGSVVVRQRDPAVPRPRDEKKGARYQEMDLSRRTAEMERDHYKMMWELQSRAAPQQQQSAGPDPEVARLDTQIAELRKQRTMRYENLIRKGSKVTTEERAEAQRELEDIELKILDTWADRREASKPKTQRQGPDDTRVISQMMRVEYPEVFQDRRAWQHAQGLANLLRSKGETLDLAKTRDILAQARTFRQNGYQDARPRPTERQKRNYAGRPSGARSEQEGSLSLSPELQKKILLRKKPGESDAQTLKRWAAKNGRKFQERLRERA